MFSSQDVAPVFSFLFSLLKHFRLLFLIQIFLAFAAGIQEPIRSYFFKLIFDSASESVISHNYMDLWKVIISFTIYYLITVSSWRLYDFITPRLRLVLKEKVSFMLSERLLLHSNIFYQDYLSGSLANKINDVVRGLPIIEAKMTEGLLRYVLQFSISLYMIYYVHPILAFIMLIWIVSSITFSIVTFPLLKKYSYNAGMARSTVVGHIVDIISNMINIHLFSGKNIERQQLKVTIENASYHDSKRDWFFLKINAAQSYSFILAQSFSFYFLVKGLQAQLVSVGDLALVMSLNGEIIEKLWYVGEDMRLFAEEFGNVKQGLAEIMLPGEIQDALHAQPLSIGQGEIVFENVHFNYKGQPSLFQKKSIRILPQQKVGLVGFSGSGKSTFVKLILRIFDIQSGRITIDGQDITHITQQSLRNTIAMIPQEPTLFQRSIMDNIRYARQDASEQEVIEAAKKAGAHDFIMQLKNGYDTIAGPQGTSLSGGQRQCIAIARILLKNNASILIFDEPTTHLDSMTDILIQQNLHALMPGKTTVIIAHRLTTLLPMDRILVFDKGHIVQDGTHQELMATPGLYKTLWNTQVNGFLPNDPLTSIHNTNNVNIKKYFLEYSN